MTEIERRFRVDEFVDDLVWIELLEGEKSGLQFAVPISHSKYSDQLAEDIRALDPSDRVTAKLVSENERNTAWRFESVEEQEPRQQTAMGD